MGHSLFSSTRDERSDTCTPLGAPFTPLHPLWGNISLPNLPILTFKAIPAPQGFENPASSQGLLESREKRFFSWPFSPGTRSCGICAKGRNPWAAAGSFLSHLQGFSIPLQPSSPGSPCKGNSGKGNKSCSLLSPRTQSCSTCNKKSPHSLVLHPEMLKGFTSSCSAAVRVSWGRNAVGEAAVQHQMIRPGLETQLGSQGSFSLRICPKKKD